ncbi:MFS transporter [Sulfobacillus sp. hq2]|uniref:MFS transporter n=1 Tax=Sulfobacillus thermotolerans TaxID=338644 RepID=A0ABN5H3J9_9FIRM|nr:MFS transporter [Sulfobacillus sp. hq2]AUW95263.1 MFS transporter [Sulfobacillus thermotolerans]MCY0909722.1 MFS transporter [Sulfobacillus thermotolerans]POB11829.1 MFS transporter [Sulfobacillus sp. hq2]
MTLPGHAGQLNKGPKQRPPASRWRALAWITIAELLAMSVWFSASAVVSALTRQWQLTGSAVIWLTSTVQLGFVGGALLSATLGFADRFRPRMLMGWGAMGAALTTAALLALPHGGWMAFVLRTLTGAFLSIVYPVAVQWVASWFPTQRGLAVGILIGGLTVGSALPHLLVGVPLLQHWQAVLAGSAVLAVISWAIVLWIVPEHPGPFSPPVFRWNRVGAVLHDGPVMWANLGYWGHMWELYAMWAWLPAFLLSSWHVYWRGPTLITLAGSASFAVIGLAGFAGALAGGWAADRYGRTWATIMAMSVSGSMALIIGFTYHARPLLTLVIALIWGFSVIADSAQFSASVTELAPKDLQGSALTLQMAVGFLITIGSINLIGFLAAVISWHYVLMFLAIGPAVGIWAMARLRRLPDALKLAHGRR